MNLTHSLKNYERGQIAQAAHAYLNAIRLWGRKVGTDAVLDETISDLRIEFARLIGNQLQYRPDWSDNEEAVNVAKLVILMAEGYIPELFQ